MSYRTKLTEKKKVMVYNLRVKNDRRLAFCPFNLLILSRWISLIGPRRLLPVKMQLESTTH